MASNFYQTLEAWSTDTTLTAALTGGQTSSAGDIQTNDSHNGTEVGIAVSYGTTVTGGGVIVYVLGEAGNVAWESVGDSPWSFTLPAVASTTVRRRFWVPPEYGRFRLIVANPATNSTLTAPMVVSYRPQKGTLS